MDDFRCQFRQSGHFPCLLNEVLQSGDFVRSSLQLGFQCGNSLFELLLLILQGYRKGGESPFGNQPLGYILVA